MVDNKKIELRKQELRHEFLARRRMMSQTVAVEDSRLICQNLDNFLRERLAAAKPSGAVFSYLAYGREVDLHSFHQQLWRRGWPLAAPRTIGLPEGHMQAYYLREDSELEKSALGIWEPAALAEPCPEENIALALMPGVAFDRLGGRLGHGGGHYDRFVARLAADTLLIGVGYEWQILDDVPQEAWDKKLDFLVTEKRVYTFRNREV